MPDRFVSYFLHQGKGYSISEEIIKSMKYHEPYGEGDAHFVDVEYWNGVVVRYFRPDIVEFDNNNG